MRVFIALLLVSVVCGAPQETKITDEDVGDKAPVKESVIDGTAALDTIVSEFDELKKKGVLPVEVPDEVVVGDTKFGTVNIFGQEVPIIILAKIGLTIVKAVTAATGAGGTAGAAAALASGAVFPQSSDPTEVARILEESTGTASAIFEGPVKGEMYFAQAKLPEGEKAPTIITAKFTGLPAGTYQIEVRENGIVSDACANVGSVYSTSSATTLGMLGRIVVGEDGSGSAILSKEQVSLVGTDTVLGRSVVVYPVEADAAEDASASSTPAACAVIVRH